MKKKFVITIVAIIMIIVVIVLTGLLVWVMPKTFGKGVKPENVEHISVFDGTTGESFAIDNPSEIESILDNLKSTPMRKSGISLNYTGYSLRISFVDKNGKEVIPKFIMNSDSLIRKDPFFYTCDGGLCYDYIRSLKPATMKATVVEVNGQSLLVTGEVSNDLYHLSVNGLALEKNPVLGDIIEITFSGGIQESYPAGFYHIIGVKIVGHDDTVQGILLQE